MPPPFPYTSSIPRVPQYPEVMIRSVSLAQLEDIMRLHNVNHLQDLAAVVLHPEEKDTRQQFTPESVRMKEWLLGRMACKDALRQWALETQDITCFPSEIALKVPLSGKPFFVCEKLQTLTPLPDISISHGHGRIFVALSLNGTRIGIDFEDAAQRQIGNWLHRAFADEELKLIKDHTPETLLPLWTAKEAAAKALGTGLMGRWREWCVREISEKFSLIIIVHDSLEYRVRLHHHHSEWLAVCQT